MPKKRQPQTEQEAPPKEGRGRIYTVEESRALYPDFDERLRAAYNKLREMGREQLALEAEQRADAEG